MLFDRRLLQQGKFGFLPLSLAGISAVAGGFLSFFQAKTFSQIIKNIFLERQPLDSVGGLFLGLAIILALRSLLLIGQDLAATRAAFQIKHSLRERVLRQLSNASLFDSSTESRGEVSQVLIDGVDALEPYFAQYLPQALVAFLVPPILCMAVFLIDPLSGVVFLVTAPLIPFFMRLIGEVSERQTRRQWGRLSQLSAFLLDALQGLPTIKRVGRSREIGELLGQRGDEYRRATLETLRTTFLSALVMEMLSTLSTAIVAVQVGLRLLYGWIPFEQALFVLVIAPEFYLPLRQLGQRFHAGMSGLTAWKRVVQLMDFAGEEANEERIPHLADQDQQGGKQVFNEIVLQGISFAYPGRDELLKEINATLKANQITVLIGKSGSGKTTLLNLLLRFLQASKGHLWVDGRSLEEIPPATWWQHIGYAPQFPFLFKGTVRENIAFAKPHASMAEIQHAAALAYADEFIAHLPQGYDTQLGENGYGLSAGEKQRLILARAYLKGSPLLIIDESTANIDPQSIEKILLSLQNNVNGRMILVVSHQPQVWAIGHRFWVLEDGKVSEFEREQFETWRSSQEEKQFLMAERGFRDHLVQGTSSPIRSDRAFDLSGVGASEPPSVGRRIFTPNGLAWKPWLSQMWSLRSWVFLAVLLGWAAILSNVGLMSTSAYIISFAALQPSIALLQTAIVGVRFFGISRGVFRYLERLTSHRVTLDLLSKMRVLVYRALEPRVPQVFGQYGSGELLSRLIGDIAALEPFYVRAVSPLFVACFVVFSVGIWLWATHAALIWVALGFYLLAGFIVLPFFYFLNLRIAPENPLRGAFNERLVVYLQGLTDLKVNQRLVDFQRRLIADAKHYGNTLFQRNALMSVQGAVMTLFGYALMWFTLRQASSLVYQGSISGLALAGLGLGVLVSFEAFLLLPQAVQHLVTGKSALSRLSEISAPPEKNLFLPSGTLREINPFRLQIEKVCFTYRDWQEGKAEKPKETERLFGIREVSFSLDSSQRLGIVGQSGAGKTTLLNLLLGMLSPESGSIRLGGKPLEQYDLNWWRSTVASSTQDDYLFQTTLRENLLFLNQTVSEEKIWQSLEATQLADFVRQLPQGLDTPLGTQGKRLSGGERQRLLLARTLLREAPLYILDEPTANLDLATAEEVMRNLLAWTAGRALIVVSHQPLGFDQMDEILVLEQGKVVQHGTHEQLLRSNGYYARLWREGVLRKSVIKPSG